MRQCKPSLISNQEVEMLAVLLAAMLHKSTFVNCGHSHIMLFNRPCKKCTPYSISKYRQRWHHYPTIITAWKNGGEHDIILTTILIPCTFELHKYYPCIVLKEMWIQRYNRSNHVQKLSSYFLFSKIWATSPSAINLIAYSGMHLTKSRDIYGNGGMRRIKSAQAHV